MILIDSTPLQRKLVKIISDKIRIFVILVYIAVKLTFHRHAECFLLFFENFVSYSTIQPVYILKSERLPIFFLKRGTG